MNKPHLPDDKSKALLEEISVPQGPHYLTPKPDFDKYDAADWVDAREDAFKEIRPAGMKKYDWYELPLTEAKINDYNKQMQI